MMDKLIVWMYRESEYHYFVALHHLFGDSVKSRIKTNLHESIARFIGSGADVLDILSGAAARGE